MSSNRIKADIFMCFVYNVTGIFMGLFAWMIYSKKDQMSHIGAGFFLLIMAYVLLNSIRLISNKRIKIIEKAE